jgi:hypothetical protein
MLKFWLILTWVFVALLNQLNIRHASQSTIGIRFSDDITHWIYISLRVSIVAAISLVVTALCYRYFGFIEFLVAQSSYYVFSLFAARFILNEIVGIRQYVAVVIIVLGVSIYYA